MRTQSRNWSLFVVCLVGCLVVGAIGVGVVAADESYDLYVEDAVDVPPQTVDDPNLNKEHEIDAFAVRQPGESLDVIATAPDGESFYVDLYNSDQDWETGFRIEGSETVTFNGSTTSSLEPGTYSLMLDEIGGPIQALHPVVISGYDISVSHPDKAERDGTLDVSIDVTPTALEGDPADVEVVLWNDSETITETATGSDGEYSVSIDLDGLDVDEYNITAAALGEEEFRGQPETLGLSDRGTIDIVESESENDEDSDPENDDGSDSDDGDGEPVDGEPVNGGNDQLPSGDDPVNENETDADPEADDGNETDGVPEAATEVAEIVDEAPDSPGVQISFENTTVQTLTLANESATGNVTVTEHSEPPTEAASPEGTPLITVEITVPETERNESATLEFSIDADAVNDSEELVVERYVSANDTWTQLETTASETTDSTITVTAETPGFSIFAVTESANESTSSTSESNSASGETSSDPEPESESDSTPIMPNESEETLTPEDQSGFGVLPAVGALVLAVCSLVLRRSASVKISNYR